MVRLLDFLIHIDVHLAALIVKRGIHIYILLGGIIFVETGLVIMPFLPWDSLLFAAWSLAALWSLHIVLLYVVLLWAAIIWDNVNYRVWRLFGKYITKRRIAWYHIVKPEHLEKTHEFFEKYWTKTIIIARFIPIVRTCTPFVAWVWRMKYSKFLAYDTVWWITWISLLTFAWYFFWQQHWVKHNFEKVIILIMVFSMLPLIINLLRRSKKK